MYVYEFINNNEPVTFLAPDDQIAFLVAVYLGKGMQTCKRVNGVEEIIINSDLTTYRGRSWQDVIEGFIGKSESNFTYIYKNELRECCLSFAYTTIETRKEYDEKLASFSTADEQADFKIEHEKQNRKTDARWVYQAWMLSKMF